MVTNLPPLPSRERAGVRVTSVGVSCFTYPCQPVAGEGWGEGDLCRCFMLYIPLSARRGRDTERGREQLLESLPKGRRAVHGSASSPRTVAATYQTHYPRNVRHHSQKNLSAPCALCGESVRHPHTGHVPCPDRHANVTPSPYAILSTFSTLRDLRALRGESSPLEHLPP